MSNSRRFSVSSKRVLAACCLSIGLLVGAVPGCGGGGSTGGGGIIIPGPNPTNTPPPSTGGQNSGRTHVATTIVWGGRSRALQAPGSAQSAVMTIPGAGVNGGDFQWTLNRDNNRTDSYHDAQTSPSEAKTGDWQVNIRFFSQGNGSGDVVGTASKAITLGQNTTDIGEIGVQGTVASVAVLPRQHVNVNSSLTPSIEARDSEGRVIALAEGVVGLSVAGGQSNLSVSGKQVRGMASGVAQLVAFVDGKSSAPENFFVGTAGLTVNAVGTRGPAPVSLQLQGGSPALRSVTENSAADVQADWIADVRFSAPETLGDRRFVRWLLNGQQFSTSASVNFSPLNLGGATRFTAVYEPQSVPAGGFTPNYSPQAGKPSFVVWQQFPVKVFFNRSSFTAGDTEARLRAGFDRWVQATGGLISYQAVGEASQATIQVQFGATPPGKLGYCDAEWIILADKRKFLTKASITLRSDLQSGNARPQPLETIAAHEFGHALGLIGEEADMGHSSDRQDTMYMAGNEEFGLITARDLNTILNAYVPLLSGGRSVAPVTRATPGSSVGSIRVVCE